MNIRHFLCIFFWNLSRDLPWSICCSLSLNAVSTVASNHFSCKFISCHFHSSIYLFAVAENVEFIPRFISLYKVSYLRFNTVFYYLSNDIIIAYMISMKCVIYFVYIVYVCVRTIVSTRKNNTTWCTAAHKCGLWYLF